jgi:hypothetical protein
MCSMPALSLAQRDGMAIVDGTAAKAGLREGLTAGLEAWPYKALRY